MSLSPCPSENTSEPESKAIFGKEARNGHSEETEPSQHASNSHFAPDLREPNAHPADFNRSVSATSGHRTNGHITIARQDAMDMASLCAGDGEAMTRLMNRHALNLRHLVAGLLGDEMEAEDVVEEAFIRIYRRRHQFDPHSKFASWLYTIVRNLALNRLRSRTAQPELVPLEALSEGELQSEAFACESAPDTLLEQIELQQELDFLLYSLPPRLRQPLELFECEDVSQKEIARRCRCTPKAVESRVYRARKRLRAELANLCRSNPLGLFPKGAALEQMARTQTRFGPMRNRKITAWSNGKE